MIGVHFKYEKYNFNISIKYLYIFDGVIMNASMWGFIGALLGTFFGALASILTTIINARNASNLQNSADTFERIERAREFQKNNFIQLQDELIEAMRFIGRIHLEDMVESRKTGVWGKSYLSEEVSYGHMLSNQRIGVLTERIANEQLRLKLYKFLSIMNKSVMASSEIEGFDAFEKAGLEYETLTKEVGSVLRENS